MFSAHRPLCLFPPIRSGHISPTTSAKVFISMEYDVRDGETAFFQPVGVLFRASHFLFILYSRSSPFLTSPRQSRGRFRVAGGEGRCAKREESRTRSASTIPMYREIKVYYRDLANIASSLARCAPNAWRSLRSFDVSLLFSSFGISILSCFS